MLISAFNAYQSDNTACLMLIIVEKTWNRFISKRPLFGNGLSSSSFLFPPNIKHDVLEKSACRVVREGSGFSSSILVFLSTIPTYKNVSSFFLSFSSWKKRKRGPAPLKIPQHVHTTVRLTWIYHQVPENREFRFATTETIVGQLGCAFPSPVPFFLRPQVSNYFPYLVIPQ